MGGDISERVELFIAKMADEGYGQSSVNITRRVLTKFAKFCAVPDPTMILLRTLAFPPKVHIAALIPGCYTEFASCAAPSQCNYRSNCAHAARLLREETPALPACYGEFGQCGKSHMCRFRGHCGSVTSRLRDSKPEIAVHSLAKVGNSAAGMIDPCRPRGYYSDRRVLADTQTRE